MRLVISLTTIQSRIWHIKKVILSILNQDYPFDVLYVNIPKNIRIPFFLKNLNNPKLEINICEKDLGPITKLVPTLEKEIHNDDTLILICDDDIIWQNPKTLSYFMQKHNEYPNDVLSLSGFCIGKFPFYFQECVSSKEDVLVDWVQGCHGILLHNRMLNPKALLDYSQYSKSFQKILYKNDDHWIAYHLFQNHICLRKLQGDAFSYFSFDQSTCKLDAISMNPMFLINVVRTALTLNIYNHHLPFSCKYNKYSLICLTIVFLICLFFLKILNK